MTAFLGTHAVVRSVWVYHICFWFIVRRLSDEATLSHWKHMMFHSTAMQYVCKPQIRDIDQNHNDVLLVPFHHHASEVVASRLASLAGLGKTVFTLAT